jgi:hypothetical protein
VQKLSICVRFDSMYDEDFRVHLLFQEVQKTNLDDFVAEVESISAMETEEEKLGKANSIYSTYFELGLFLFLFALIVY